MRNSGFFWKTLSPVKRLVLLFGLTALVILAPLLFIPLNDGKKTASLNTPKTKEEIVQNLNKDSDGDGLKDWEEKIYGTRVDNADTDGDGTSDGEEIKLSRHPLRPSPGDELSITLPPPEDENKTQAIANELIDRSLTQVIAESITGQPLQNASQHLELLKPRLEEIASLRLLDKVIPPETRDFRVSSDNSPETVKKYFNAVAEIYRKNFSKIDSDINILYLAATGNNPKTLRRLDVNIAAIEKAIEEIKKTPTPSKWIEFAKDDVWYLSKSLAAVKILRNSENDPASSLLILNDRIKLIEDFRTLYLSTAKKLSSESIIFAPPDPATALFYKPKNKP